MVFHNHEHNDADGHTHLSPARLEAFSDGVMAIIITITVLNFHIPQGSSWNALSSIWPLFIAYLISFQTVGTYWNNHHHLLQATKHVSADIMWTNLHLLFWLSLIPFATGWLGANHGGSVPTAFYASVLLLCGIAYTFLQWAVVRHSENREQLKREMEKSPKGLVSIVCYVLAVPFSFVNPLISDILIVLVAFIWFIPDRRIEKYL